MMQNILHQSEITPILVIGASRNGTTSLVNLLNQLPGVAKIEHVLHHGSHEAKLHGYYKYYGGLNSIDKYIDFLYHYASEDYFHLAGGDIDFHLKNRRTDFFQFFFDMMDRHCQIENKKYWVAKIDSSFFTDRGALQYFLSVVNRRYKCAKYIRIQRDLLPAAVSAKHMEGRNFHLRKKALLKYYFLMAYTQSWFKTYLLSKKLIPNEKVLDINFDNFIGDRASVKKKIIDYIGVNVEIGDDPSLETYKVNTSFTKNKPRQGLGFGERNVVLLTYKTLKLFPSIAFLFHKLNSWINNKQKPPMYRKIIKYNYYRDDLEKELESLGADGLLDIMKGENS